MTGISVDLNDEGNLEVYTKLVVFRADISRTEFVYHTTDYTQQRTFQTVAYRLGLQYEYTLATHNVRITRTEDSNTSEEALENWLDENLLDVSSASVDGVLDGISAEIARNAAIYDNDFDMLDWTADVDILGNQVSMLDPIHRRPEDLPQVPEQHSVVAMDLAADMPSPFNSTQSQRMPTVPLRQADSREYLQSPYTPTFFNSNHLSRRYGSSSKQPLSPFASRTNSEPMGFQPMGLSSQTSPSGGFESAYSASGSCASSAGSANSAGSGRTAPLSDIFRRAAGISSHSLPSRGGIRLSRSRSGSRGSSRGSVSSAASGRTGPLSAIVRRAAEKVKEVGACWRCKILKKSCNPESPCAMCPRSGFQSRWGSVGCKRGALKSKIPSVNFCPRGGDFSHVDFARWLLIEKSAESASGINEHCAAALARREKLLVPGDLVRASSSANDYFLQTLTTISPALTNSFADIETTLFQSVDLATLDECILAVIWEIEDCAASKQFFGPSLDDFFRLIRSAAFYQVEYGREINRLVPQSLICLRSSVEVMRIKAYLGTLTSLSHQRCNKSGCEIQCIQDLNQHLESFMDNLSGQLFLRYSKHRWLTIFYSLCIQAIVRKVLMELVNDLATCPQYTELQLRTERHLYLAVRLFNAVSSAKDPLTESKPEDLLMGALNAVDQAKLVVQRNSWTAHDIHSSATYLERIFEDSGGSIMAALSDPSESDANESWPKNQNRGEFICHQSGCIAQPFQTQVSLILNTAAISS